MQDVEEDFLALMTNIPFKERVLGWLGRQFVKDGGHRTTKLSAKVVEGDLRSEETWTTLKNFKDYRYSLVLADPPFGFQLHAVSDAVCAPMLSCELVLLNCVISRPPIHLIIVFSFFCEPPMLTCEL